MPNDPVSENTREKNKRSGSALVSWFEANKGSSMTAKRFFALAERGWIVPDSDAEANR